MKYHLKYIETEKEVDLPPNAKILNVECIEKVDGKGNLVRRFKVVYTVPRPE